MNSPLSIENIVSRITNEEARQKKSVFVHYIKIYTSLVIALECLNKAQHKRSISHLKMILNFIRTAKIGSEEAQLKRIKELISLALKSIRCQKCKAGNCRSCEQAKSRTHLLLAQNICLLRMFDAI